MMSPHDRRALLRAFYGLLTLWVFNGFTGFIRAAGPGAAIIYIELGLLIGYWVWVFYWWRTNRPKAPRSAAKKPRARQTRETVDAEVRRAVDLEEAVARERNRRRKAQLQRTAGKVGSQVGSGINQLRYVLVGLLVLTIGIFGYQAYDTNRKEEEARIERQATKDRTVEAMSMWRSRNACLASEFEQRWQAWYAENPETQTVKIYTYSDGLITGTSPVTRTLPTPESLDDTGGTTIRYANGKDVISWRVSEDHFKSLVGSIRFECGEKFPPPAGSDYIDNDKGVFLTRIRAFNLVPANMSICEDMDFWEQFDWQDPFNLLSEFSYCNFG
jgi:hypothetical protein